MKSLRIVSGRLNPHTIWNANYPVPRDGVGIVKLCNGANDRSTTCECAWFTLRGFRMDRIGAKPVLARVRGQRMKLSLLRKVVAPSTLLLARTTQRLLLCLALASYRRWLSPIVIIDTIGVNSPFKHANSVVFTLILLVGLQLCFDNLQASNYV